MDSDKTKHHEFSILGLKLGNFFRNLGCCGGDRDDISIVSKEPKHPPGIIDYESIFDHKPHHENPIECGEGSNVADDERYSDTSWLDPDDFRSMQQQLRLPSANWPLSAFKRTDSCDSHSDFPMPTMAMSLETQKVPELDHVIKLESPPSMEEPEHENPVSANSKKINKARLKKKEPVVTKALTETSENEDKEGTKKRNKRRIWTPQEDAIVLEMVSKYGQSWSLVASYLDGRSGKQIRDRYLNKLMPNINTSKWTPLEDQQLLQLYFRIGHKWSTIAGFMKGRTETQVKNRFYSHIKKKILSDVNTTPMMISPNILMGMKSDSTVTESTVEKNETKSKIVLEENPSSLEEMSREEKNANDMISYENELILVKASSSTKNPKKSAFSDGFINFNQEGKEKINKVPDMLTTERSTSKSVSNFLGENQMEESWKYEAQQLEKLQKRRHYLEQLIDKTERDIKRINPNITFEN